MPKKSKQTCTIRKKTTTDLTQHCAPARPPARTNATNAPSSTLTTLLRQQHSSLNARTKNYPSRPNSSAHRLPAPSKHLHTDLPNQKNHVRYPHFLLHGIEQNTLKAVVAKIEDNSKIIHETRAQATAHYGHLALPHELALGITGCDTEDYFGICHFLHRRDTHAAPSRHGTPRQKPAHAHNKNYTQTATQNGFTHAKIVRPNAHPYAREQHRGFIGKYENAILAAGITQEN